MLKIITWDRWWNLIWDSESTGMNENTHTNVFAAVVCYFDTPTPLFNLHMNGYDIAWYLLSFFLSFIPFFHFIRHQMLQSLILFCAIWWHYIYITDLFIIYFKRKVFEWFRLECHQRHMVRWTMCSLGIVKLRVQTSNTHRALLDLCEMWVLWGQEVRGVVWQGIKALQNQIYRRTSA